MRRDRARAARLVLLCVLAGAGALRAEAQPRIEGPPLVCLSPPEARQLFVANRLMPPFRILREAAFSARAEAIDIQLCRFEGALVYDVTLLNEAGEIMHRLLNAGTGAPIAGYPASGQRPAPQAGGTEPRPGRFGLPAEMEPLGRPRPYLGPAMGPPPGAPGGGPTGAPSGGGVSPGPGSAPSAGHSPKE